MHLLYRFSSAAETLVEASQTNCMPFEMVFDESMTSLILTGELIALAFLNLGSAGVSKAALRFLAVPLTPVVGLGVLGPRPSNLPSC